MENLSYDAALATPGFATLAHRYAYLSDYYAASHPSLPNYLALTGGSTFGVTSDCLTCFVTADNLAAQLATARISWGAYFQSVSTPCYLGTSYGVYAAKHNPFRYYRDVRSSRSLCSHLLPLPRLYGELSRSASAVPRFTWVSPNVCDDGHSCSLQVASSFLSGFIAKVTASAAWRQGGVLFVTWDEGSFGDARQITPTGRIEASGGGGHVLTLVVTPGLRGGVRLTAPLNHYGLLATIEQGFGLPLLKNAAPWKGHTLTERLLAASG